MLPEVAAKIVLVTCESEIQAWKIATAVVKKRLAACVNMVSAPVQSVYRWREKVETATEYLLIMKTTADRISELQAEVLGLHSYDTPEFLVLGVEGGSAAYLEWIAQSVSGTGDKS